MDRLLKHSFQVGVSRSWRSVVWNKELLQCPRYDGGGALSTSSSQLTGHAIKQTSSMLGTDWERVLAEKLLTTDTGALDSRSRPGSTVRNDDHPKYFCRCVEIAKDLDLEVLKYKERREKGKGLDFLTTGDVPGFQPAC
ncbi:uncharacterized protein An03g03970 [Aspergillus niger]|uniref:Contig An03c0120, genomic contig n=2 Tax=Aspergillus niger TaxID=5061 RepID=A2QGN9_ASPNC|nr:uncharacterized protein An03g03970 [Aspergillus niger]CAK47836.1 unnamed protein product [Aspergillus niger]